MGIDLSGLGAVADAATGIVNKFMPDKTEVEKLAAAKDMAVIMNEFNLAAGQQSINLEESKSEKWYVAGWRPFIGWVCGVGLLYQFLFMPVMNGFIKAVLILMGHAGNTMLFVSLDVSTLVSCVGGLLGLGVLRTYEKRTDSEKNR